MLTVYLQNYLKIQYFGITVGRNAYHNPHNVIQNEHRSSTKQNIICFAMYSMHNHTELISDS